MTTIILDPTKKPSEATRGRWPNDPKDAVTRIAHTAKLEPRSFVVGKLPGAVYHANYLSYLEFCWAQHYIPVLTPDILWYTLLCEIAGVIRTDPEAVRPLFSETTEKQRILVYSDDPEILPLDLIVDQLRRLVPSGADNYLPTFTTTTDSARFAHYAAFCDAVSPYYSYGMFMCGLPAVRILGTVRDYVTVAETWRNLPPLLWQRFPDFFAKVYALLEQVALNLDLARGDTTIGHDKAREFFRGMFVAKYCGSGSQIEISGWYTTFFREHVKGPRYASNFASHISRVEYDNVTTKREYVMLYGLFSSTLADGVATPEFSPLVFEPKSVVAEIKPSRDSEDAMAIATYTLKSLATSQVLESDSPTVTTEWSTRIS